jgi:hypothetical protein
MTCTSERGYAMAALLVALSVMSIMLGMALPAWRTMVQREREAELVFRGEQYMQAISLYSRRTGGFPTSLNALRDGRFIRKLYKDPITNGDFQPVYLGQMAAAGAVPGLPGQQPLQGRGAGPPVAGGRQQMGGGPLPTGRGFQFPGRAGQAPGGPFGQTPGGPFGQTPAAGPIIGVSSRSTAQSLRLYNGRNRYNEWLFVSTAATSQPGIPAGAQTPGPARGRGPLPGRGRGPGLQGPNSGGPPTPLSPFGGQRGRI